MMLPDDAPEWAADPEQLWQRAEDAERRGDAQTARLVEVAIPREVPADRRLDLMRAIAAPWVADGMTAQVDVHCPLASDGAEQPHGHVELTMRRFDGDGLAARKERAWNAAFTADRGRAMRGAIADRMNAWLLAEGLTTRVDHRTHEAQGVTGPAPERDISRRAWAAHRADPASEAAAPVREVMAERRERRTARRDMAWEAARAAYAAEAAAHYGAERERRQAARKAEGAQQQAERDTLRRQQQAGRQQTYRQMRKGLGRTLVLAVQRGAHDRQRDNMAVRHQADRMHAAPAGTAFSDFGAWLDAKAESGDPVARAAAEQRAQRRVALAQRDPAGAAKWAVDDAERTAQRVLRERPHGSVDADALFTAEAQRLNRRRDQAEAKARAARQAVADHKVGAAWWTRATDPTWRQEHARLTSAAHAAQIAADRITGRHNADVRMAREAARRVASEHRRELVAWLDKPEVRRAQAQQESIKQIREAMAMGDDDVIGAAAKGDLAGAAQAAQGAQAKRQAEEQRQAQERRKAEEHQAAEAIRRQREEQRRAAERRRDGRRQPSQDMAPPTGPKPGPGLRPP